MDNVSKLENDSLYEIKNWLFVLVFYCFFPICISYMVIVILKNCFGATVKWAKEVQASIARERE